MTEVTQIMKRAVLSVRSNAGKLHNRVSGPLPLRTVIGAGMRRRDVSN